MMNRRDLLVGAAAVATLAAVPVVVAAEKPKPRYYIVPSIGPNHYIPVADRENNCWTNVYSFMDRWDFQPPHGGRYDIETCRVGTERYAEWLRETPPEDGIPPHICFGGAIVPGEGDSTFYARWQERTRQWLNNHLFGDERKWMTGT